MDAPIGFAGPGPFGSLQLQQPVLGALRAQSVDGWKRGKLCDVARRRGVQRMASTRVLQGDRHLRRPSEGGTVLIPAPLTLLSASLFLRSNLTFRVERGATLRGTTACAGGESTATRRSCTRDATAHDTCSRWASQRWRLSREEATARWVGRLREVEQAQVVIGAASWGDGTTGTTCGRSSHADATSVLDVI